VIKTIQNRLRYVPPVRAAYDRFNILRWNLRDRPIPPPYGVKRRTVLQEARRFGIDILVETGTWQGDMMLFAKSRFRRAYSIELDHRLFTQNQVRFRGADNIELIQGDSAVELPRLVARLRERALFWLDGHYCGPGSGWGMDQCPIRGELACIFEHPVRDHVILIDDARLFVGKESYPTIDELREWTATQRPEFEFSVADDIIRITPPRPPAPAGPTPARAFPR
jgi:hypothetical protein